MVSVNRASEERPTFRLLRGLNGEVLGYAPDKASRDPAAEAKDLNLSQKFRIDSSSQNTAKAATKANYGSALFAAQSLNYYSQKLLKK